MKGGKALDTKYHNTRDSRFPVRQTGWFGSLNHQLGIPRRNHRNSVPIHARSHVHASSTLPPTIPTSPGHGEKMPTLTFVFVAVEMR